jgi:hypothetical protein
LEYTASRQVGCFVEAAELLLVLAELPGNKERGLRKRLVDPLHQIEVLLSHTQLRGYLADFVNAYGFTRRLKTPTDLARREHICKIWTSEPE